jgi:hypothetical protein
MRKYILPAAFTMGVILPVHADESIPHTLQHFEEAYSGTVDDATKFVTMI